MRSELSMRRFREIARVSGLVIQGHPGQQKSARQLQASSGLFDEIFRNHDRGNLLLNQADDEVLLQKLDARRIRIALERMNASRVIVTRPRKPTPFSFPLNIGRLREKVSTKKLADRVERMLAELEKAAHMKPALLAIEIAGHPLVLSSLRASFDPVLRCLFIADAHFGKDAVFRARGIPVPVGSTADNLMRLDILIAEFEPVMLVFLGDLLHARESHATEMLDVLHAWRERHASLRVVLVEGNRDRHAGRCRVRLSVEYVREPWHLGPWALCHQPRRVDGAYVLAGHVHPVYRITTRTDSVRVPCFRFGTECGVLRAFGSFTGGAREEGCVAGEKVCLVLQERVIEVSAALG